MDTNIFDAPTALKSFLKRKTDNANVVKVDNTKLKDGEKVTFYCLKCNAVSDTLPKEAMSKNNAHPLRTPKTICKDCSELVRLKIIL